MQEEQAGTKTIPWVVATLYLFIIAVAEVLLLQGVLPVWVMAIYGLMLISLIGLAAWNSENLLMYVGLASVPVVRIVAFGTPYSGGSLTIHFGITGLVLLFYIIAALRIPEVAGLHLLEIPQNLLVEIAVMIAGAVIGYLQFLVHPQAELLFDNSIGIGIFIAVLVLSAFVEEVMFRGIALTGFANQFGKNIGNVFVSLLYAFLFIPFGSFQLGLVMFLTSLLYGYVFNRTSKLYGIIGAHFVSAVFYYLIFPVL